MTATGPRSSTCWPGCIPQSLRASRCPPGHCSWPARQAIDQALASLGVPWTGGPYAEPGRDLLARYEQPLRQAFARFDGLLDRVREAGGPHVITHGEPHPGNLLRTRAGLCLVDWDMTALARPERDLWWVISGDQDAARYSRRTGWTVNQDALALYRLRWDLDDIAESCPRSAVRTSRRRTRSCPGRNSRRPWRQSRDNVTGGNGGNLGRVAHQAEPMCRASSGARHSGQARVRLRSVRLR